MLGSVYFSAATGKPQITPPMIHRLISEDWPLIFPLVALLVATLVYGCAALRGSVLESDPAGRLERLPLDRE
jgi:hypothetical protein